VTMVLELNVDVLPRIVLQQTHQHVRALMVQLPSLKANVPLATFPAVQVHVLTAVTLFGMLIFSTILPALTEVLQMPARTLVLAHRFQSLKVFGITFE